jgi:chlorobactene lauroyltransferase
MLEANKSAWFEKIFAIYNRNLLKRRFSSLQVLGLEFIKKKDSKIPLIIYANHSSWWDGLVFLEILRKFHFENYVMMEEKQLRQLSLFRRLGAFSVVREKPREAVKSVNYAANLLKENPNRMLLIFPQGEILPNDLRPLKFYNGLARIIEKAKKTYVAPTALRYEFLGNYKPEIFVKIGETESIAAENYLNSKALTEVLEKRLTGALEELKQNIISNNTTEYIKLF